MDEKIRVHIADDHQILIDGVKAVLNLEPNIEVNGFSLNGVQVIEWFQNNSADVLILDINMPVMDGKAAYGKMIEIKPDLKVLVASGYTLDSNVEALLQKGAHGFIQKPYSLENIAAKIKQIKKSDPK